MNPNLGNVNMQRTVSKYLSITPFDDSILDLVKGPSNKEVSKNESLRQVHRSDANTKILSLLIQI